MKPTLSVAERERLLKLARAAKLERSAPQSSPIVPVERGGRLALSFAQQRLWFLEQLGELGSTYHIPERLRLRGALDGAALARALERIVARHESLRTVFVLVDGEPEQRILPVEESGFALVQHDLRGEPHAEAEVERLVAQETDAPFDLERGPLVRACLLRLADDDHLLLLTMHHVVSDAWSLGVFTRELGTLYTAFSQGEPDPLPALPVQYADYAVWQRNRVKGEVLEAQAAYWTQALAGAPELLELPTDHARPARQDHAGALLHLELGRELTAGLRALSHRHGTTLYMTVLAGWAAVLARLSGQDDVVVGTPSANRAQAEVEDLIGFFVNTLALRVDLSARPTVAGLLAQVKTRALEGQRNQDIPFEQVVERLRPTRSLAYSPLFQVMFAWHNGGGGALQLPGLTLAPAASASYVTAKFDLLLSLGEEDDGGIAGDVEYATSLFEQATVERWVGYLRAVLEAMVADDARSVDRIPILPEAERALVLREFNDTRREYPREACVHELFEAQVERTPGAVAVVFEGERVTYAELNARANRLAHHLRTLGVCPDTRVGICVERSVEMVVGLLGILKAGGAYVPLDASYPVDRLRNMVEDSHPAVLLTHPPQAATAAALSAGSAVPVLDLTGDEAWADRPATNPGRDGVGARNLAHVLFTSGSTGRPKGVMLEHGSLVNRLAWMQDRYGMTPDAALLQKTPFSFDVSFWEFFWPLMVGARLVMARPDGHRDPAYLVETIRREGITVAHFVPSMLQLFLEHPDAGRCTGLLRVPVSGEAVSAALVRQFHQRLPGVGLFNQYGPTESGEVTEWACDPGAERVSIGRAIHNSAVYVLDRAGEPVPVGVAGELFIGGVAVARGYLGRPRLTAERFVPDPFGEPGARLYRTGDLCRWLADGTLEYLGRTDFQVKVRGFRVELGEIEARLASHPEVREAVALALDDGAGGKRLVGYFVGEALESEALRAHLSQQLPEYMVPAAFVRLDAFPVTPNGKLDRKALPAPDGDAFAARAYEAPLGEVEEALAAIWAELLGTERVGRRDDFFALGGHSLLAVRVVSRVRRALGVEAEIGDLFIRPVLADFARGLQTAARAEATAIVPVERSGPLALSFAQQRLWFIEQMEGAGAAYHLPMGLRLRGELDREALMRALERIVARHEALRTSFPETDGVPAQRISAVEECPFHLAEHDLEGRPEAPRELGRLMAEEAESPFDLARGPLVRGRLIRLAGDDHVLLVTMHHIVSDGWSLGVFIRELSALYAAFHGGRPDPLPPLPVQYADYAAWQRQWVKGEVLQRQADYWRETLSGAPELLELPADHARPARQSFAGAWLKVELDEALTAALKTLGQRHGATLYMTLLAGWAAVLARLSGQDEVVVGTPSANRGRSEIEGLIGFFVNTLALRVDLSGSPSVAELLGRVRERALGAQHHQDIPFEQVVELVQPARSLAHTPLFQVMFAWQNAPEESLELPGLALGPLDLASSGDSSSRVSAKFDLSLSLWEDGGGIEGVLDYATALLERETVERWLGYLRCVLEEMVADDAKPVHRLDLLSAAERRRVVEEWNATDAVFPAGAFIHEFFEAQVERTPGAAALVFEDETLSYTELNARANRLAHHLRALGVGPEVRVGLCAEASPEMVVGVLGVLKAGGAYVPLDPGYPAERLAYTLADSAPAAVLVQTHLRGRVESADVPVLELDGAEPAWASLPATNPGRGGLTADHLAYVIYTSGSTGRPKGVRVPHGSVGATLAVAGDALGFGAGDRVPSLASFAFDIWLFETLLPLLGGGSVRLVPRDRVPDVPRLVEDLAWCTSVHAVPALMRRIVEEVRATPAGVLDTLRRAFVGGDAVAPDLLEEMRVAFPAAEIHVLYGPTEAAIICAAHRLRGEAAARQMVGRPLGNAALYVVEPGGTVAPVGVPGELCLGGASVARDYLGRPGLTAELFVPDPFAREAGARLYRTGDRVRWLADGSLEFLGRTDHQVKVRGFRIEPGEIEARLAEHPGVREAVVLVREDTPGEKRLVAYVAGDETAGADVLRAHLSERLPEYMVPAAYVRLETLPLTPNGKVDRKALPAPEGDAFPARGYEAPSGRAEEAVAGIWAELLGAERVGRRDHFFELGGHSLLATRVISRIREVFGVEVPLRALFEGSTVAELAGRVEELRRAELPVLPPVVPVERTGALPLSFAQERLWFIDRLEPGSAVYNIPMAWRLGGALDEAALERALGEIVRRHEALRTVFREVDGSPVQVIAPFAGFALPVEDLSGLGESDREAAVGRRAGDEARRAFDLSAGPLFRAALLRLGSEDHVLLLSMHHIVSDGWSMGVLFRELSALYEAYREGRESPLPELAVQYADYAVWQRQQLAGKVLDRQLAYWKERLAGAPELLELPTDRPRPPVQTFRGATVPVELAPELLERLQALGRSEGATLYTTLLAAFQVLLSKYAGSEDVVVGSPIAGRTRGEVEELIGFFVNTLVLRTDLSGDPSFREALRLAREATLGAYEHQELPFERLVAELQPERSLSHSPLFQVMFTLQDAEGGEGALPGLEVSGLDPELGSAKFDLSLTLGTTARGLRGGLDYSTDLFERGTVERMLGHLQRVLEQVAADADVRLSQLELVGDAERALVLEAWNRTERPYPRGVCIHELFDAQVRERPEAVALVWGGAELTYAELATRANRLAHNLAGRGVGPEARVGVMLERGVELIVSVLAVLKAGGCYVPLDPGYPAERLRLMLDDSGVRVLISRGDLAGVVETGDLDVVHLDRDADVIASAPIEAPRGGATAENLAYIVYTSGSTGRPKGVMVGHRQVVQLVVETDYVQLRPGDRVAQASNAGFDALTFEVWGAFLNGATLVGIPQDVLLSPRALRQALREERITTVFLTTALVNQLASEEPDIFAPVREVLFGGQAVDADSVRRLLKAGRPQRLLHMYGPTETTTFCLYEEVEHVAEDALTVPLGHATGNQRIYLLDGALNPVPRGVPGEAYVGGGGVARGYLDRPGLTAERFIPDPFSGEPGARMYRTGDRMRWRGERKLEFVGRVDEQVKIRGFRIEPGEIEAVLSAHAAVREARVIVSQDARGEKRLVAYVVGGVGTDELREHVRRTLPDYMVPAAFEVLEALPLTPNGKLDRKALPAPELASAEDRYVAPRTPTEEVLAGIWAEMLGRERVGAEESFFDLGGHSLLATRVAGRVRAVFGVEMPLRAVFERPVLRELAAEIDRLRGSGAASGGDAIAPAAREGDLPVTFAQERLWFVDALDPGSPVYAIPFSYGITGRLDHYALRRALAELVRRHEPLRTTLPAVDGVPVQRIAPPPADFDLPVADLRELPDDERRAEAERLAAEAAQHRFDLARGPLFRASLVRIADDEHHLLLNLHHAIGDGWSLGVLLEELSALYGAFSRGEPSPLPEPSLQYADYAVWQRERLSGAALERQVEFWRRALDGAPALLELPTDRPRPPVESHRGGVERLVVPSGLAAEVHALARREGATLFMVLLAALDVVLGRLAGQDDVVVGTPIAGRTRAETDRMVGLFLNSLALRTDLSGDPTFREMLGRVRETTLSAYAHQELPFERVLEEVRPERSLAHAPVFQVMLNLANFQDGDFRAEGLEVAQAGAGGELASKFDLTLYVGERDGEIVVSLVYAADLFDAPRMRVLLAQLEGVLRQAAAAPETRIGALSLATDDARDVLPDPAEPLDATWRGAVHEVFAAQARRTPDALAVEDPRDRWTYADLDAATDRIARTLADAGVGVGDVVAITGHRSAALVRALVGTMKSGAAFLVLDPAYPAARLGEYVRIARPAAHLHLSAAGDLPGEVAALLAETIRTRVVLRPRADGSAEDVDGLGAVGEAPRIEIGADTLAYLSFTSGTTGTPKAVMGRHSSLTHFTPWLAAEFGLSASDRFSLLSGLAHDPLHRDVFTPLQLGASVVAPEPDGIGTPGYLARWMREAGVTVAHLTPAMGQLLADAAEGERIDSLRRAFFVGDVLRRGDVQRLAALAPNLRVINYYGSTETQRAVSYHMVDSSNEQKEIIPLGRGIPGVQLLVRNASGEIAGIGEVGEIWLRSPHLAAGYLGDAALSASRFVVNPWTGEPRDRLYRTGDLGRYRPDGEVEPMGRADQQVKVRGFRVELGEVESALTSHPAIKEAAVIARETEGGDRRLVAYWVPIEGSVEPDAASLRLHLKALLPEYMVPSAYVRLDRLPLTANGKLDRRALPEPEAAATDSRPAAPRTPTEEILAQIWAEVLRTESVGVDDDFFALGGHSLLATRLLARVQNALGVALPLRAIFEGPTVAELAERVEEVRRAGLPVLPPVVRVDRDRPLPLSFAQERLWFLDRLEGGSAAYNLPAALRLTGALDAAALERSLGEIVRRHESLRTVFHAVDGGAVQVTVPFAGFALPLHDLSGLDETAREAEVRRRAGEDAARPFDLAEGPLFRAALLRLSSEEHVLLWCIHHIVSDGWSTGVLFRELGALYEAYRDGAASPLAEPPVQYADYAVWQREQLQGEVLDRQVGYWKERLAGAPALLELPTDRPRPPVQSHRGARERFDWPRALLDRLQALGRGEGATLYMVMLGAFQLLLSKYSGSEDILVGSPIAGRTRKEVEELIGFFVNTLVLRTDLSADPTFRELLGRVREGTLGAYEHQEVPFERLVAELQPERSLSHSPVFQVMFALQNVDRSGSGLAGLRMEWVDAELETGKVDLALTAVPYDGGVHGVLEYSTDLFDRSTVRRMLGHLERVLEQAAADADVRLSDLDLLGEAEREQVLGTWNHTGREYADPPAHALFAEWARRAPEATALLDGREAVTYGALDRRAAILARHLRDLGVGPETPVGLCMERTPELLVGVLGIWKAGGAYVPLDPGYPAERLGWIISDAALPVVVATEDTASVLPEHGATLVRVDQLPDTAVDTAVDTADAAPEVPVSAAGLAYVIYTSGSTGRPKGVLVQHGSLSNLLAATREAFGVGERDVMPALASYAFDIWLFEALLPLTSGAAVRLVERERVLDVPALVEEIADATLVHAVPALMRQVVQAEREMPRLGRLRRAFVGGDQVPADLLAEMREALPGAESHVLYGPTEATILASTHPVPEDGRVEGHPIGRPLGNVRLYVCDAFGNAQPAGVPGELLIGGAGVARGYLGRAGLTAERFVPDPFSGEGGARLYRTGDRARWRADGTLEFLGRVDAQVKIRGFRIEPGEIEAVLRGHESVADCVVVAREDAPGDRRLVAYVVGGVEVDELREHLRRSLPEYMVPAAFVVLEALPLTPNGKLDRKALPAPEYASAEESYVAPRTPVEEVVAGIWAEVLKVERVGVHDNFFALGGHSLLAVTLVERMRRRGVRADVRALFLTPTVAELAAGVEGTGSEVRVPPNLIPAGCGAITPEMLPLVELTQGEIDRIVDGVPGGAENVQDIYPLAPLQEGILFHHLLDPESDPYLLPQPFAFDTREQRDAYLAALQAAVARHDILRTSVVWEGLSEPVQVVWRHAPLLVEEVEVDPAAGDAARHLYERVDPLHQRVDLRRAPLLRAWVGREAVGGRWGLLLLLHHIVSDHTTADVLREEMEAHLDGRADQLPAPLPFRNYVAQARLGVSRAEHEAFFRELLGDVDEPTAPFGLREVRGDGLGLEQGVLRVEEELGVRLRERARRLGVSVAAMCHVAWAQVLARTSGRSDVVFGTVLFGRMQGGEGADRVLGPFINTLPVRIGVGEGAEAGVRRTQALLASLVRHEHASLALAQQMSGVPAPEPLFSALFNYRHTGGGGGGKSSARGPRQAWQVMERSNYPVNLSVNDWGEEFSLTVQAEAEVGADRVCALMHTALVGLVQALEEAPERPLETIEVLPEAERRQLLEVWSRTAAEVPANRCVHELFAEQAARTPDTVAVRFEEESLSYAELDARANQLAHYLRGLGVGPEVRVGLCVERSPEMVVAVLAVLKAGGAYVPLDPEYPAERLAFMLQDAAVPVLLTQSTLEEKLPAHAARVVRLDVDGSAIAREPAHAPESRVAPQNLAYVIYTSGSTGRPKGAAIPHGGVARYLAWAGATYGFENGHGAPVHSSLSFDLTVTSLFVPLLAGEAVVLAPDEGVEALATVLRSSGPFGFVKITPAHLSLLLEQLAPGEAARATGRFVVGGESLPGEVVARWGEVAPEVLITNEYGPTETVVGCCIHTLKAGDTTAGAVPIGRPSPGTALYALDGRMSPCPIGVPGELFVGGGQLGRGYLARPALTAERFVPDPFSAEPGARLYRTGDLVRWRADGNLEFMGRLDEQVKIRGFRIELGEIEARLAAHAAVREARVVVREDQPGDRRLVAYVVGDADAEALRAHLRQGLPEYMVPAAFVVLEALPLTPNGKLDRKALPAPEYAADADRYVAPRTPVEEVLAEIWAEVLHVERVGVHDNFFDLGGHSLLIMRLLAEVQGTFDLEISIRTVFSMPTLEAMAEEIERRIYEDVSTMSEFEVEQLAGSNPVAGT